MTNSIAFNRRVLLFGFCAAAPAVYGRSDFRAWKMAMSTRFVPDLSAERFKELKQAGIDAVELGIPPVDAASAADVRARARKIREWADSAGVEIWSVHIPFGKDLDISSTPEEQRESAVRRILEILDVYAPLRPKKLVIHGSAEITSPIPLEERQARIAACRKSLAELAPKASAMDAQVALESLPRSCLGNTSEEVLTLIRGIDAVGVCIDTNHALQEKTEDFIRRVGSRVVTIHASDYDGIDEKHWLPGKGINNWTAIVQALQDVGYTGPFLFECQGTPQEKVAVWKDLQRSAAAASANKRR